MGRFYSFSTGPGRRAGGVPARTHDLEFFDLGVIELDRGRPAEDRDRDLEPGPFLVDVLDGAVERSEGAVGDLDLLADLGADGGLGPLNALLHLAQDAARLGFPDGNRPAPAPAPHGAPYPRRGPGP